MEVKGPSLLIAAPQEKSLLGLGEATDFYMRAIQLPENLAVQHGSDNPT